MKKEFSRFIHFVIYKSRNPKSGNILMPVERETPASRPALFEKHFG